MDTLVQVMENEPPRPRQLNAEIPLELEMICLRCLEKKPANRYQSAGVLADDLERFLHGEAIETPPPDLWHRLHSWARRQPALASRTVGLTVVAGISQTHYQLTRTVPFALHAQVMSALAFWCAASVLWQWLLGRERWNELARWAWAATDVVLLTVLLWIVDGALSPLVGAYAMLITSAGLWLRKRLVWLTTALSVLGYGVLVADGARRGQTLPTSHWHLVFVTVLLVLGTVVAYQVHRIRKPGRYYKRQSAVSRPR